MHGGCDNESCRSVDSMPSGDAAVESTAAAAAGMPDIEDHFAWKALLSGIACFSCQIHIWPKYEIQKDNMVCLENVLLVYFFYLFLPSEGIDFRICSLKTKV